jgi:hypothetical protein
MDSKEVVAHARRLQQNLHRIESAHSSGWQPGLPAVDGLQAQVADFLAVYAGPRSSFVASAKAPEGADEYRANILDSILDAFIDHVESGLLQGVSPERKAQLDVVSDLLGQAVGLLDDSNVHPAAPAMIVGASLEEFLRTWIESVGLSLGNRKPGLSNYAAVLRDADLIQKQDAKDIESWGGLRNHAAHGEWAQVEDPKRVRLMLEGVNLFMRRYSPA